MAKQTLCDRSCMSCESSDNSEDPDDTLEAEISRLEATLNELDDNDLSEFCKSAENVENDDHDPYPYKDITDKTITFNAYHTDPNKEIGDKTITNSNVIVPICREVAESDQYEKQKWLASESRQTALHKPSEIETDICEVPFSDESQATKFIESQAASSKVNDETGEKEASKCSLGSAASLESLKTSDNATSTEYLSIHPTIDNELEALIKSPSVQIIDSSLEFSPFRTFQNKWFTSSPKITNLDECKESKIALPSLCTETQNKLVSLASLPQLKCIGSREEEYFKACNLGISELQNSSQKLNKGSAIQQAVEDSTEFKLESQSDKESSSNSVIILEECKLEKLSVGSFLNLDVSQDYEKEWLKDEDCNSVAGLISSTPYRKAPFSFLTSKCADFYHDGSFIVLDETGEVNHSKGENKILEQSSTARKNIKDSDDSVQEVKYEPKNVELNDHQELNISIKHATVVIHPPETTTDHDKVIESEVSHDDKNDEEGYVKPIEIIKSDYLFKSEDPEENADNFNPEWELLRKLQTDEERYKAMRERWRNLVIPDPNLDLTHHTWRLHRNKSKTLPAKVSTQTKFAFAKPIAESRHKRTLSDPSSSSEERRTKRSRTQSCTMLFDVKLQQLRQEIDSEQHRLLYEEAHAVQNLRNEQAIQKVQLQNYCHGYQFMSQMHSLQQEYLQNEELIRMQYKGARFLAESEQEKKIHTLEKASAEVRAFHKFYQGLENKEDNDTSAYLSESQLEELWETENFYEECEKFYT